MKELANKYINMGKDWLLGEYGDYKGMLTGMDVDEDSKNDYYQKSLKQEIELHEEIEKTWWEKEKYGYTLWILFRC